MENPSLPAPQHHLALIRSMGQNALLFSHQTNKQTNKPLAFSDWRGFKHQFMLQHS